MSVAQFVDFKRTRKGGSSQPAGSRERRNFNDLQREGTEGRPRMSDHI